MGVIYSRGYESNKQHKGQYFGPPFLRSYTTDDAQTSLG